MSTTDQVATSYAQAPPSGAQLLTGAGAVAEAMRQIDPDVVPVYPITPQTPMIEGFAKLVADGLASSELMFVESEHSAMSAALGAAVAGARTMTATSSQGLALMAEVVYIAAAQRAPIVVAVGNRALSGPINIHCDHSDSMLVRDAGVVQLFAENAQEAYDLMLAAPRIAEHPEVMLPVFVCQDGFTVTHCAEPVSLLEDEQAAGFVGTYDVPNPLLDQRNPATHGTLALPDYYYELKFQEVEAMRTALRVMPEVLAELETLTGRLSRLIDAYALDDADRAVVVLGASAGTVKDVVDELRNDGERVGVLRVCSYRPFPHDAVRAVLRDVESVVVLDRSVAPGGTPGLYADCLRAFAGTHTSVQGAVFGLGGRELDTAAVREAFDDARLPAPGALHHIGLRG
jgi:pyruvate ferredoxin oxidoreductase alpha subunit